MLFTIALALAFGCSTTYAQSPAKLDTKPADKPAARTNATPADDKDKDKDKKPRTLEGYVEQEKDFSMV
jgi:hypothetical protein